MLQKPSNSIVIVDRSQLLVFVFAIAFSWTAFQFTSSILTNLRLLSSRVEKVDSVVIEFGNDPETVKFCDAARAMRVPVVFASSPMDAGMLTQYGIEVGFPMLGRKPRMFVPLCEGEGTRMKRG